MNTSSQTTTTPEPILAHGDILEQTGDQLVLALPNTNYHLHLIIDPNSPHLSPSPHPTSSPNRKSNRRIHGRITAQAKRIDLIQTGGRLIDPVYGRPRRIQGRIHTIDATANTLTVKGPTAFVITPMAPQTANDFTAGQLVSFDVERGAHFEPMTK